MTVGDSAPGAAEAPTGTTFVAAALLTMVVSTTALLGGPYAVATVVGIAFVCLLVRIELASLPAIALAAFALVPTLQLPFPTQHGAYSPVLLVAVILLARFCFSERPIATAPHLPPLLLLALWTLVSTATSIYPVTSFAWSINFLMLVVLPGVVLVGWPAARRRVEDCWLALGGVLGAYALVELLLQRNPLTYFLAPPSAAATQGWVVYRATTTLEHPLINGTFFAVAVVLALGKLFATFGRRTLLPLILSTAGLAASVSRGATLSAAVGSIIVIASYGATKRGSMPIRGAAVIAAAAAVGTVAVAILLSARVGTTEAAGSEATRLASYEEGLVMAADEAPWGAGPGLTDILKRTRATGNRERGVESSWLQLVISMGMPGALLLGWYVLVVTGSGLRARPELAACIVLYVISAASYNLLEAYRPGLVMLGMLTGLTMRPDAVSITRKRQ